VFNTLPKFNDWNVKDLRSSGAYFHYCDNETVHGVEFPEKGFPFQELLGDVNSHAPYLVCDASSNILTRDIDWDRHSVVYGGTQKNIGPAGACV
jgi:phosphoserine aminotransferase